MNHELPHTSKNDADELNNPWLQLEQTTSVERLPHPIRLYRTMRGNELWKFINHQEISKKATPYTVGGSPISTAKPGDYHFSPNRADYRSEYPEEDTALVSEELPELDFEQVFKTWYLGDQANDDGAYSLSVEFSTDVRPDVCYGYYELHEKPYLKEYTLPSRLYNSDYLQIERIYDLYGKQVIFNRQDFENPGEAEAKLHEIADVERATDTKIHENAYGPQEPEDSETVKKHLQWIAKIPRATTPSDYEATPNPFQEVDDDSSPTAPLNNEDDNQN